MSLLLLIINIPALLTMISLRCRDSIVIGNYNRLQIKECEGDECYERKFIPIEDVVVHEHFAKYTHENDIALIRLPEAIKFGRMNFL
jgi:hypothetical protein